MASRAVHQGGPVKGCSPREVNLTWDAGRTGGPNLLPKMLTTPLISSWSRMVSLLRVLGSASAVPCGPGEEAREVLEWES